MRDELAERRALKRGFVTFAGIEPEQAHSVSAEVLQADLEATRARCTVHDVPHVVCERLHATPRIVCAWCKDVICDGSEPVSHGICPECVKLMEVALD